MTPANNKGHPEMELEGEKVEKDGKNNKAQFPEVKSKEKELTTPETTTVGNIP